MSEPSDEGRVNPNLGKYSLSLYSDASTEGMVWQIRRAGNGDSIFRFPYLDEHIDQEEPPAEVRAEYERLIDWQPGDLTGNSINIVELVADRTEASGFNQSCLFGSLVEDHAVYCHNRHWLYAPRKCRRTWYTGGEVTDETCPGYAPSLSVPKASSTSVGCIDDVVK